MNFYKVHAAKYKGSRVLFLPEQFDEIGPDAFGQTSFEYIILSRRIKSIRNHAFSGLKKCNVYIPDSVDNIEELAFDDVDYGNVFYCRKDSAAYRLCIDNKLDVSDDIDACISSAEEIKKKEESVNASFVKPEIMNTGKSSVPDASCDPPSGESGKEDNIVLSEVVTQNETEGKKLPFVTNDDSDVSLSDTEYDFIAKFGLPPVADVNSTMGVDWQEQIAALDSGEIIFKYDSSDYCDEYKYYCYIELKKRFDSNTLDLNTAPAEPPKDQEQISVPEKTGTDYIGYDAPEYITDKNDITNMLGVPPLYKGESVYTKQWQSDIKNLSTREILAIYDDDEWCDEYKYLCYMELSARDDLILVLHNG